MVTDDAMQPLERLLNLVGLLLETPKPLTFEQIRDTIEAYRGENVGSAKRKFERDKDALRAYGIPLEMRPTDAWEAELGYIIPKDRYYVPDIVFTPEEITALYLAAHAGSEPTEAAQGVRKLLYGADGGLLLGASEGPLVVAGEADQTLVVAAAQAAADHRTVHFGYRTAQGSGSERTVDALGVVFRGGQWYLVGNDHDREATRAFRLSRFTSGLTDVGEGPAPPVGFRAIEQVEAGPWTSSGSGSARVACSPDMLVLVEGEITGAVREDVREDGWVILSIPVADPSALVPIVLGFGPAVEVLEPAELRAAIIERLAAAIHA
jgi:proteasome accessory factor B